MGSPGGKGPIGKPGPRGMPGQRGPPSSNSGHLIVRHSQDARQPGCPEGFRQLWTGFSLMYTVGNGQSHSQDLGKSGSCIQRFSTLPFLYCTLANGGCKYATRNDYSYWLAGDVNPGMRPVSASAIDPFISKCAVCQSQAESVAVHSQDSIIPDCPNNFESLWTGYSFLMVNGKGKTGAGQQLSSPGSCLPKFMSSPSIECTGGRGTCSFFSDKYSFWLAKIAKSDMFKTPVSDTFDTSKQNVESRISRCRVCMRRRRRGILK